MSRAVTGPKDWVILVDGGDLIFAESRHEAENFFEPEDVGAGGFEPYDFEGRPLRLHVDHAGAVRIAGVVGPPRAELLRGRVIAWLESAGPSQFGLSRDELDSLDLGTMLLAVFQRIRQERARSLRVRMVEALAALGRALRR